VEKTMTLEELHSFQRRKQRDPNDDDGNNDENEGLKVTASLLDELSELQGDIGFDEERQRRRIVDR
jgi:hypothetical protein